MFLADPVFDTFVRHSTRLGAAGQALGAQAGEGRRLEPLHRLHVLAAQDAQAVEHLLVDEGAARLQRK